jgi:hypothetical protein
MDNVYTSPVMLILLKNQKVYSRGTVRKNFRMVPHRIVWMKKEAEDAGRGALKENNVWLLNWMENEAMGIEDHRGGTSTIG